MVSAPDGTGDRRLAVSDALASSLLRTQFPDLAGLEVGRRLTFDDHVTIRFGERLCANFPTTRDLDALVEQSGRWSPSAALDWGFLAGVPLFTGEPTDDYPVHWEIAPWLPGSNATIVDLAPSAGPDLGRALRRVHRPAPPDAPPHPSSSKPLSVLQARWDAARSGLADDGGPGAVALDYRAFDSVWAAGVAARSATKLHWIHGNLDPRYIVSDQGRFGGICTWFTFSAGDPAADIGAACAALPVGAENAFFEGYGEVDEASIDRARAFRLLTCAEYAASANPFLHRLGWARLEELQHTEGRGLHSGA